MSHASAFSATDDATIIRMREIGCTWKVIADAIGHKNWVTVRDHAYRKYLVPREAGPQREGAGAVAHAATQVYAPPCDRGHDIMPAFHPVSWGAIWHDLETRP